MTKGQNDCDKMTEDKITGDEMTGDRNLVIWVVSHPITSREQRCLRLILVDFSPR
jgi:hypothetical protein